MTGSNSPLRPLGCEGRVFYLIRPVFQCDRDHRAGQEVTLPEARRAFPRTSTMREAPLNCTLAEWLTKYLHKLTKTYTHRPECPHFAHDVGKRAAARRT